MSATATKSPDQARGKIMRLPFKTRMAFNRAVRDGYTGRELIAWLKQHNLPGVNAQNISKYKRSASYRNWLEEEKDIERDRHDTEQAMRLADALGGSASDKLKSIFAGTLFKLSRGLSDPDELAPLIRAFNAVTRAEAVNVQRQRAGQLERMVDLREIEVQRRTCELFITWIKDRFAREIAEGAMDNAAKIEALRKHYFADVDDMVESGKVALPE